MAVYLVTWDLNKEGSSYTYARNNLLSAVNEFDNEYSSSLDSVRFISTTKNADSLYEYLWKYGSLDSNDTLVVVKIERGTNNHQGNLGKTLWDWINARI